MTASSSWFGWDMGAGDDITAHTYLIDPRQVPMCSDKDGNLLPGFKVIEPLPEPQPRMTLDEARTLLQAGIPPIPMEIGRFEGIRIIKSRPDPYTERVGEALKRRLNSHADRKPGTPMNTTSTTTASTASTSPPMDASKLLASMAAIVQAAREEPIAVWMRSQGFDPARGCRLVLPESMREPLMPSYVHFSRLVDKPTLFRDIAP